MTFFTRAPWKHFNVIYHLHISHNSPYLAHKILHNLIVFHFPWVLQLSQEKLKTMLMPNFWGQISCIMGDVQVAYGNDDEIYMGELL